MSPSAVLVQRSGSTARRSKVPRGRPDEERLTADLIALARQYGRYGYRKIAGLLEQAGWIVNDKRAGRIWKREGLKVPISNPSAAGALAGGRIMHPAAARAPQSHVWSYDFVEDHP
jgi:putative transposase